MRYILLITLACTAISLRAQDRDVTTLLDSATVHERTTILGPRLGKHLFSPLAGQSLPMIRTFTTANLGFGVSSGVKIPVVIVGGRPVNASVGSLALLMAHARHEQAIKPWMSFYAEFGITGRLGTNVTSLLAQGVNTAIGFDIGWKVRVLEDDEWSIVTGLSLKDASYVNIDAIAWAEDIIDSGFVGADTPLLDTKPALRASWTAGAAHSFSEMFGLYGDLVVGLEEPRIRGGDYRTTLDALLAVSVDWNNLTDVPFGTTLGLEYKENPVVTGVEDGSHKNIYLRIGYTGQDAFGLGVQAIYQFVPIGGIADQVTFVSGLLDMRFYF